MVSLVVQIIRFFPSGRSFARYDVSPPRLMLRATDVGRRRAEVVSVHAVMRDTFAGNFVLDSRKRGRRKGGGRGYNGI